MLTVCIRTVFIYFFLIVSMRLMGKRQVGELEVSELIVTFMLSEIAANPIMNKKASLLHSIVSVLLLLSLEVIVSLMLLRFPRLKKLMVGKPSMIISHGVLDQAELKKQRMCMSELISALRQQGIADVADVQFAILEENGKLSVFPKASRTAATPQQLKIKVDDGNIARSLIIDGEIVTANLNSGWSRNRLERELQDRNLKASDIFLFSVSADGTLYIVMKEKPQR